MKIHYELSGLRMRPDHEMKSEMIPDEERPPRIACLLALAHRFQMLLDTGQARDYAELARLGHVTRARLSQIMGLLFLAPSIQERLLFWPSAAHNEAPTERDLRRIVGEVYWERQESWLQSGTPRKVLREEYFGC